MTLPRVKNTYDPQYRAVIDKIVAFRKAKGLTQQQVADRLNMTRSIYGKVETYDRRLDIIETVKICEILQIRLEDLVGKS